MRVTMDDGEGDCELGLCDPYGATFGIHFHFLGV
jgi:hypothetical protein